MRREGRVKEALAYLAGFGAVAGGLSFWILAQRPPALMDHAQLVTSWLAQGRGWTEHRWAADGSLRFLTIQGRHPCVVALDPATGRELWSRQFGGVDGPYSFSPDGSWLLYWIGEHGGAGPRKAVSVDGPERRLVPAAKMRWSGPAVWKPGGREWVEVNGMDGSQAAVYDLSGTTQPVRRIPSSIRALPLWIDSSDRLAVCRYRRSAGQDSPVELDEINLRENPTVRRMPIELPEGASVIDASLSPDERHVAWLLGFREPRPSWLQRILAPQYRTQPQSDLYGVEGIWISDREGGRMRELGRVRTHDPSRYLVNVQWMPKGDRVSFLSNQRLYSVPANN